MSQTINIDGHDIELQDPEKGCITTDVIILRRFVFTDDDCCGHLTDGMLIDHTRNATGITRMGMYTLAQDVERGIIE